MPQLPLEGIRVVELCTGAAGPTVAKCLGEYGAEILKIESRQRGDGHRGGTNPKRWNVMPDFVKLSRNKKSVTVNLKTDRGKEIVKGLIAQSDVVVDNYSLGVLERWGMSYEELKALKPDIILIRLKGLGCTGPYAHHITYGPNLLALSGITHLWNHPNSPASTGEARTQHPDFMSGIAGAAAVMSALLYRERTGKGQCIDFAQIEAGATLLGPYYLDYTINGRDSQPAGNALPGAAPHNAYPCAGGDKWCVISVRSQEEWLRFCQAIGQPEWCRDERFATPLARQHNLAALDELVASWTCQRSGDEVMRVLQPAGVAAAPVQDVEDQLSNNPQFEARHMFTTMDEPMLGPIITESPPAKMSETPPQIYRVAPLMGEHTDAVLRDILHLSESEIKELTEQGVLD
jgi:crotonobetainyl-CoA:carnitine CoA-transferase CaiB-like acyl-CoA transferase